MLVVLSPAKTLDLKCKDGALPSSTPIMMEDALELLPIVQKLSVADLKKMFSVSDAIAKLNHERFRDFDKNQGNQAAFAFDGPAYKGLGVATLKKDELQFCQDHLRILCGLYGVLRPCDNMKPYRLEMGTKLPNPRGKDLYAFWGDSITDSLNEELKQADANSRFLVNCASQEYFKSLNAKKVDGEVYNMMFPGPSVYAKQARGAMVRYICEQKVQTPDQLKGFAGTNGEWRFNASQSTETSFVFVRSASASKPAASKPTGKKPPSEKTATKPKRKVSPAPETGVPKSGRTTRSSGRIQRPVTS